MWAGPDESKTDFVALGEVMLRLDPGEGRISSARSFQAWEGGAEYNVARALSRVFRLRTAVVTALVDNPIGRLIEDLMYQGGVDLSHVRWIPFDGVGRESRNGLHFAERGFGVRAGVSCFDRGHSAASLLKPGEIDWDDVFRTNAPRWFHTGGVFAALSSTSPAVAREAMEAARSRGIVVSYDLNYRSFLWKANGGLDRARAVNRELVSLVDVLLGNEEDFTAALGFEVAGLDDTLTGLDPANFGTMMGKVATTYPNVKLVGTTLRNAKSASRNDWGAVCWASGQLFQAPQRLDLEILDRLGGGDAFASGLIYALMKGHSPDVAVQYGAAHGALAMTTPGDNSMATLQEIERTMTASGARFIR